MSAEHMDLDDSLIVSATGPAEINQEASSARPDSHQLQPAITTYDSPSPPFREMQVKVHVRRPGKDTWSYVGRATATHETMGHSSRVVITQTSSGKVLTVFSELSDVQAEKRGNFVVLGAVESGGVVSWSLNANNNSETLKLLASIELACYRCGLALADPGLHTKVRRRVDKLIKEDRKRRHRRRKDDDDLANAFGRQTIL